MGIRTLTIEVKPSSADSNLLATIKVKINGIDKGRANILEAQFDLEIGERYEFAIEIQGKPGEKYKLLIDPVDGDRRSYPTEELALPIKGNFRGREEIPGSFTVI